jgi:hypothetical protein
MPSVSASVRQTVFTVRRTVKNTGNTIGCTMNVTQKHYKTFLQEKAVEATKQEKERKEEKT